MSVEDDSIEMTRRAMLKQGLAVAVVGAANPGCRRARPSRRSRRTCARRSRAHCRPMTREEVVAKARDLMTPPLGASRATQLIEQIMSIDGARDIRALRPLLQGAL